MYETEYIRKINLCCLYHLFFIFSCNQIETVLFVVGWGWGISFYVAIFVFITIGYCEFVVLLKWKTKVEMIQVASKCGTFEKIMLLSLTKYFVIFQFFFLLILDTIDWSIKYKLTFSFFLFPFSFFEVYFVFSYFFCWQCKLLENYRNTSTTFQIY